MNSSGTVTNGIGQPVRRKEDFRLLTGRGSFADDVRLSQMAHAMIVRSLQPKSSVSAALRRSAAPPSTFQIASD
jgi:carbon-monoxide dehydrogenase large subunit